MGWIFEGVTREDFERKYSDKELFIRTIKRMLPYKRPVALLTGAIIGGTITTLTAPLFLGLTLELLLSNQPSINLVILSAGAYLGLLIISWVMEFTREYAMALYVPDFMVDLRFDIFESLMMQDFKFYDQQQSGQLNARVSSDAGDFGGSTMLLTNFIGEISILVLSFIILLFISPILSVVGILVVPILLLMVFFFRRIARITSKSYRQAVGTVNATMAENVGGIAVAKSFGQESGETERFRTVNRTHYIAGFRRSISMSLLFPSLDLLLGVAIVLVYLAGGVTFLMGLGMSPATLYIFVMYLERFFYPVMQVSAFYGQFQAGLAAFERICEVLDAKPEVKQHSETLPVKNLKGDIVFEKVNFSYVDGTPVLKNFDLHIKSGEKLAIVGHTGAGKTSLINLLSRFYEFQEGKILVDGIDIRKFDLDSYRRHIGIVQQDNFLFSGTIEENIRYGFPDSSPEEIRNTIAVVHAAEFIDYLDQGMYTEVRERGSRLSMGERQLVCFARALLANPKILILDEATASVDAYTESVIQEALEKLLEGRTSIVIAHRLTTVKNADRIIVLDHGKIVEEGTHDHLMDQGGVYAQLYDTYFKHQSLEWVPTGLERISEPSRAITP